VLGFLLLHAGFGFFGVSFVMAMIARFGCVLTVTITSVRGLACSRTSDASLLRGLWVWVIISRRISRALCSLSDASLLRFRCV
jgi:hypothetical protein